MRRCLNPTCLADLFNRIEDKWFVLFQIALARRRRLAGALQTAALADLKREEANDAEGGLEGDLLARPVASLLREGPSCELHTRDFAPRSYALERSALGDRERRATDQRLLPAQASSDFMPDNAEDVAPRQWRDGKRREARGYHEQHFEDAFARYLGKGLPSRARTGVRGASALPRGRPETSVACVTSVTKGEKATLISKGCAATDELRHHPSQIVGANGRPAQARDGCATDGRAPSAREMQSKINAIAGKGTHATDATDDLRGARGACPTALTRDPRRLRSCRVAHSGRGRKPSPPGKGAAS